jgi:hypothetical protein
MAPCELAQMNVARLRVPPDSPQLAVFVGTPDRIDSGADGSPGFVLTLQYEPGAVVPT